MRLPAAPTSLAVEAIARAGLPIAVSPDEVRSASQWWTYRNTKARRELGFEPRPHEETMEDAVRWQMGSSATACGAGRAPQEAALAAVAPLLRLGERVLGLVIVLYRCPTRTNVLCPCGAVAQEAGEAGLEYRTERVPYRRSGRPEIEELTRQSRVPVLVDGDEVVHDSKRIIQYSGPRK